MSATRTRVATGAWALAALAALALGVGVGRSANDGADGAPTPAPTSTSTTAPPGSAPSGDAPTNPGPPLTFTRVDEVIWPADPAALRTVLDALGFPDWWPLPDAVAPPSAPYSTVQQVSVSNDILPGDSPTSGAGWTTMWLVDAADLVTAEATFVAKVPADRYDVDAGTAARSEVVTNDAPTVSYDFPLLDANASGGLSLTLEHAIHPESGERLGILVEFSEGSRERGVSDPVPVGAAPARQFLAQAPVAPEMTWSDTFANVEGGVSFYDDAVFEPGGLYKASWLVNGDDVDAVIAFLSDPASFVGDLKPATEPEFVDDELWTLKVAYQGLAGEYTMLTGDPSEVGYLYLEFPLT